MDSFSRQSDLQDTADDVFLLTKRIEPCFRDQPAFNWMGFWTLTGKEIDRFLKIAIQTIVSPLLMILLFYAVFSVSMAKGAPDVHGVPFLSFLIPGLVIMSMAQSAFFNTSSALILSKLQGNIVDILMPPLSSLELTLAYAISGMVRGLVVGIVGIGVMSFLYPIEILHPFFVFYYAAMGSLMLSLMGVITGIWGEKFEHMGAIQNFVIMPATFLSGSFFSVSSLPQSWAWACTLNPFFYMIDGFRYGFTGQADASIYNGVAFLLIVNMALCNAAYLMFENSPKIKP